MKFSILAIVGALAAVVSAKADFTNTNFDVEAGQPFTLAWTNATGPVTIQLVNGDPQNLKPVGDALVTGATGGTFTWTPPATLPSDTYAFKITDSTGVPNFSKQFTFAGSASASPSSAATTSTTSASSSASSTSSAPSTTSTASNSTTSSSSTITSTTTTTKTSSSATTSATKTTVPTNNNDGQRVKSSLALVLLTMAALICFN